MENRQKRNLQNIESYRSGNISPFLSLNRANIQTKPGIPINTIISNLHTSKLDTITESNPIDASLIRANENKTNLEQWLQDTTTQTQTHAEQLEHIADGDRYVLEMDGTVQFQTPVHIQDAIRFTNDGSEQSTAFTTAKKDAISEIDELYTRGIQILGETTLYTHSVSLDALELCHTSLRSDVTSRIENIHTAQQNIQHISDNIQDVLEHNLNTHIIPTYEASADINTLVSITDDISGAVADISLHLWDTTDVSMDMVWTSWDRIHTDISNIDGNTYPLLQSRYVTQKDRFDNHVDRFSTGDISAGSIQTLNDHLGIVQTIVNTNDISLGILMDSAYPQLSINEINALRDDISGSISQYSDVSYATAIEQLGSRSYLTAFSSGTNTTSHEGPTQSILIPGLYSKYSGMRCLRLIGGGPSQQIYVNPIPANPSVFHINTFPIESYKYNTAAFFQFINIPGVNEPPLLFTNTANTQGMRIPVRVEDTTTRMEIWPGLDVSGGTTNPLATTTTGEAVVTEIVDPFIKTTRPLATKAVSSNICSINYAEGDTYFISGVTGNFDISLTNLPLDTTREYKLRLYYSSAGGYGTTITAKNTANTTLLSGASLRFADLVVNTISGIIQQNISVLQPEGTTTVGLSQIRPYSIRLSTIVWTERVTAPQSSWTRVKYGNGIFVAVSQSSNKLITSSDGITWTTPTFPTGIPSQALRNVAFGNGKIVVTSQTTGVTGPDANNRSLYSADNGVTWTAHATAENNQWRGLTYGNGTFVAVSSTGTNRVMTSIDGFNWTSRSASMVAGFVDVAYGNGLFVAITNNNIVGLTHVMTSPDGITWTTRNSAANSAWTQIMFENNLFVATAQLTYNSGTCVLMTSPNGIDWTPRTVNLDTGIGIFGGTYGDGMFVLFASNYGLNPSIIRSISVDDWTNTTATPELNKVWLGVAYGNNTFVAVPNTSGYIITGVGS